MSGLDKILDIIDAQQKQTEDSIMRAAHSKAASIKEEGDIKAKKAYDEHLRRYTEQAEREAVNAKASIDAQMKRRILSGKVELIDEAVEKALKKLEALPDKEYFELLARLAGRNMRKGEGVISLSAKDLKRVPESFAAALKKAAAEKGGTVTLSKEAAPISDGFILSYGLISENCSFRAIMEAEKDAVRDTAACELFGQVSV